MKKTIKLLTAVMLFALVGSTIISCGNTEKKNKENHKEESGHDHKEGDDHSGHDH